MLRVLPTSSWSAVAEKQSDLKGKKRAFKELRASSSSLSLVSLEPDLPLKKSKRAVTKICPVCNELIPLRLLSTHAELESERLEEIIRQVGSTDILYDDADDSAGPCVRSRRSALRARKSLIALGTRSNTPTDTLDQAAKTIQTIRRRRKHRHGRLREMAKEEDEGTTPSCTGNEITCPVCLATVRGDQDVLDAHVDACLANENQRLDEQRQREIELHAQDEDVWNDIHTERAAGHVGNVRGTGFHTRDRNEQDVDDEVDVDGDDQTYGHAQFTEGDIVHVDPLRPPVDEDMEVEIEGDGEDDAQQDQKTLWELVAEGEVGKKMAKDELKAKEEVMLLGDLEKLDVAIVAARTRGNNSSLIAALENKVKHLETTRLASLTSLCRICLDPYSEPTVSTGCWHTCCRECWLRCLGSTKLCPVCKRITGAADLRRVYL